MRHKDVAGELAYVFTAQYCCALPLAAENQPDHFDVLTFASSSSRQSRVRSIGTLMMLCGATSGFDGECERQPRQCKVCIGHHRFA